MLVYDWEDVSKFYHFYDTCVNVAIEYRYLLLYNCQYSLKT